MHDRHKISQTDIVPEDNLEEAVSPIKRKEKLPGNPNPQSGNGFLIGKAAFSGSDLQ